MSGIFFMPESRSVGIQIQLGTADSDIRQLFQFLHGRHTGMVTVAESFIQNNLVVQAAGNLKKNDLDVGNRINNRAVLVTTIIDFEFSADNIADAHTFRSLQTVKTLPAPCGLYSPERR